LSAYAGSLPYSSVSVAEIAFLLEPCFALSIVLWWPVLRVL
jgi:hypothetical protein